MPSFLNRDRYVKVTDLDIGQYESYTDYEELSFTDTSTPVYDLIRDTVVDVAYYKAYRRSNGGDYEESEQLMLDRLDTVFFMVAHVVSFYEGEESRQFSKDEIRFMVETCIYTLDTLTTGWLIRSGHNWKDLYESSK